MQVPIVTFRNLAFTVSLAFVSPFANANRCGDISPLFSKLGEQYYDLENTTKSALFEQAIPPNDLIDTLQTSRFRAGEGQRTRCFGSSSINERVINLELKSIEPARINSFNEIVLAAFEYDKHSKTAHRETVFIPLSRESISLVGDSGLVVNSRHRQPVNPRINTINTDNFGSVENELGNHIREIAMTASSSHDTIRIKQLIYVNGYLAEWFTWTLKN